MTSFLADAMVPAVAVIPEEGQLPVWLTLAIIAGVLIGGLAAAQRTTTDPGAGHPDNYDRSDLFDQRRRFRQ
ncbi:hypothetical protein [Rhodococcus sp. T7]|uniref:hypothetical protein n=1 Tax=Rhodococcus sp. T7 TaxID=627444 RepID=UPI00135AF4D6|nr:hypothetical protein [Rhodococcus sp. T7]KAF0960090.1 hypothetical protein MLGJGCBP_06843 [Rhodococcus sp. T7]